MNRKTRVIRFHRTGGPEVLQILVYPPNLNSGQAASANTALFLAYFALVELAGL